MVMVDEAERAEKERALRQKHKELLKFLAGLPFSENEGTLRRKRQCEKQLAQVESDLAFWSEKEVFLPKRATK